MNYHNITTDDMLNGSGLRVVLWCSGCTCQCENCQNPQTWDFNSGILFDDDAIKEIYSELDKPYISGLTLSGGHPLEKKNSEDVLKLVTAIKEKYPHKNIWIYSGLQYEDIIADTNFLDIIINCDVLVDGKYIDSLKDVNLPWCGSLNQRVIDIKKSIELGTIVLYTEKGGGTI